MNCNSRKYTLLAGASLLMLVFASSCDTINSLFNRDKNVVEREVVLPTDRESISKDGPKTYTPEELGRGVVKGEWVIETVNGKEAVGEEVPFLRFEPSEMKIYGNNGCNIINGSYTYNAADSTLSFSNLATTMRLCATQGITDMEISLALDATRSYSWKLEGSQYFLYLYNAQHAEVMSLMHQNFQFLNGSWQVTAINSEPVTTQNVRLVIDVDEGKLHGNTGCNTLNGTMEIDMRGANSISFQAFAITRKACGPESVETPLLVALEEADKAMPVSANEVLLINTQGQIVLNLQRIHE